jgi:RNA polymerase sigma-70 factor (ECF subfamily)
MAVGDPSPLSIVQAIGEAALSKTDRLNERVTSLYETHRDGVYRFLVAQGIPPAAAQEVTQDVFVKLFIALRDGTEIVSEQGWLFGVAAKSAVDHWRRERNPIWVELEVNSESAEILRSQDPSPEILAARAERLRRVARALVKLPKEQRLCVQLRSEGLRYRDIAGILGVAVSTAAGWLSTAVERLRGAAHD